MKFAIDKVQLPIKGTFQPNQAPTPNQNRAFLQLSNFSSTLTEGQPTTVQKPIIPGGFVSNLIEYSITNLFNTNDSFDGFINLYELKQEVLTGVDNFSLVTNLDTDETKNLKTLKYQQFFSGLTHQEVSDKINGFINGVNNSFVEGDTNQPGYVPKNQFPLYYRPSLDTYKYFNLKNIVASNVEAYSNISNIYANIKPLTTTLTPGYGLIWFQNSYLPSIKFQSITTRSLA